MTDISKNVRHIMTVFLFLFVGLISYIAYFQLFKAPEILEMPGNTRVLAEKNEVLRGNIYDRSGNILTTTVRNEDGSQVRTYVDGELFVHPLGYSSRIYGLSGLEKTYDDTLSNFNMLGNNFRSFLSTIEIKSFLGNLKTDFSNTGEFNIKKNLNTFIDNIRVKGLLDESEKIGNGIITTLDSELQRVANEALGNNKGAVVAIDPKSGEILAMVSKPTYDPNNLKVEITNANNGKPEETPLINRAIDGLYPPGSIFKTVTLTSALENIENVTGRIFEDKGEIKFEDGTSIENYAGNVYGNIDLREGYKVSSNVVFGTLAIELGNKNLKDTAEDFGFNSVIKGPGVTVSESKFPTLDNYESGNIAQSGIGQGEVLTTPMQMALVAATIGNNGVMMEPKLVKTIVDKDKNVVENIESEKIGRVMEKGDTQTIQSYMKYLVDNNIYRWPAFTGTNAGGKTGTADYKINGEDAIPHGWFISVAPMDNPQIAVAVIVENGKSGSGIAATVASKVVRKAVLGE